MADDKELKDQRVVTMMSPSELEAIDDWMFKNRIRSRGEAIRRLCQVGIIADDRAEEIVEAIFEHNQSLKGTVDGFVEVLSTDREDLESDLVTLFGDSLIGIVDDFSKLGLLVGSALEPAKQMKARAGIEDALQALRDAKTAMRLLVDEEFANKRSKNPEPDRRRSRRMIDLDDKPGE
jgi:hypothetical protein